MTNDSMIVRLEEYLTMRRAFWHRLAVAGQVLSDFAQFASELHRAAP